MGDEVVGVVTRYRQKPDRVGGMVTTEKTRVGPTPQRAVRVDDETWDSAGERAAREHRSLSDVIRASLRAYSEGRYDATEPKKRKP